MFFKIKNGAIVECESSSFLEVYMIDIDDSRIELSDQYGMVIGTIHWREVKGECTYIEYGNDGHFSDEMNEVTICKDGEICLRGFYDE